MKKKTYYKKPAYTAVADKTPPHDDALEQALLGSVLMYAPLLHVVQNLITPDVFYNPSHRLVWQGILDIDSHIVTPDVLTLTNQLRTDGTLAAAGGTAYIASLTNYANHLHNAEFIARALVEKYMLRQMITNAQAVINGAYSQADPFELLDLNAECNAQLNRQIGGNAIVTIKQALADADEMLQTWRKRGKIITGVQVGFNAFDDITGGFQPGELIVLAARPGMGKTAFALQLARNAAVGQGVGVAVFSLEMPLLQLTNRLQAAEANIPLEYFKRGTLTDEQFNAKNERMAQLAKAPLYIDDTASLNIVQLCARAKHLQHKHGLGLIIIDYLQLITPVDRNHQTNREQDISHISRSLKLLAKELNIPVVALSQLSRAVEGRNSKRPALSDLRESGAIEQDADMVTFLYRPEYYRIAHSSKGEAYPPGYTELTIAKHRNGGLADVGLLFAPATQRFMGTDLVRGE